MVFTSAANAVPMVAIDDGGLLWRFDSAAVDAATKVPLSGLLNGELAVSLDYAVAPIRLFLLARAADGSAHLYELDRATGQATAIAPLTADPSDVTAPYVSLAGTNFNLEFDPVTRRLRVVSNADINLAVDPVNGLVVTDAPLAYASDDQAAGVDPTVTAIAYRNTVQGATATTLLGADPPRNRFVEISEPSSGELRTRDDLTPTWVLATGFDIRQSAVGEEVGFATSYFSPFGRVTVYRLLLPPDRIVAALESSVETAVRLVDSAIVILPDELFQDGYE